MEDSPFAKITWILDTDGSSIIYKKYVLDTRPMHVNVRTFCRIILTSLSLGAVGLLLDLDHWYAIVMGWPDGRWLHHTLASTPSILILLSLLWGLVITALTLGWNHLEHQALAMIQKDMKVKLLQLELKHRQTEDDIPIELLIDIQNQEMIVNSLPKSREAS